MNSGYIIVGLILVAIIFIYLHRQKKNQKNGYPRPSQDKFPIQRVKNDKLVIVEDANDEEIKTILEDFCNMYNDNEYKSILQLTKVSNNKFVITFPYDIDFETYCYLLNYICYPMDIKKQFYAIGWATVKQLDKSSKPEISNQKLMVYESQFDTEYDNVYLTTSENIGYKIDFAVGKGLEQLESPEQTYIVPTINIEELNTAESVEFS